MKEDDKNLWKKLKCIRQYKEERSINQMCYTNYSFKKLLIKEICTVSMTRSNRL